MDESRKASTLSMGSGNAPAFRTLSVIGLGYIGLPTATLFASRGLDVTGCDTRPYVVDMVNQGKVHIVEPGLDDLVAGVVANGKLRAVLKPEPADAFVVAVGTPCREGHRPDISQIESAARAIAPVLEPGNLVILESTSPVGTTERMSEIFAEERPDLTFPHIAGDAADVQVAHCPERVLPGRIIIELVENDRVVGGISPKCTARAIQLYRQVVTGECLTTNARTAEMAKLAENSFRDANIAFANELSMICDRVGIDVWELIEIANHHPRVNILQPGPGVGGHCIAVDPWFIVHMAPEEARLIRTAREVNDHKPHFVIDKIRAAASQFTRPTIACLGLAFKPDIDDLRESPSVEIVKLLAEEGLGRILAVEPHVQELPPELANVPVELAETRSAVRNADIVVLLVNHKAFGSLREDALANKVVIDTRGMWRSLSAAGKRARKAA